MTPEEPLLAGEQVVAEWDAETRLLELRSWVPGPAGTVGVSLRGVDVELDVASPGLVSLATVDLADRGAAARVRPVLSAVVGAGRADEALALAAGPATAAPVTLADDEQGRVTYLARRRGPGSADGPDPDHPISRLGLSRLDLADPDLPALARAAALAEAAASARLLGPGLGVGGAARRDAAAAADLFAGLAAGGDLALPSRTVADELAAALEASARVLRRAGDGRRVAALVALAATIRAGRYTDDHRGWAAAMDTDQASIGRIESRVESAAPMAAGAAAPIDRKRAAKVAAVPMFSPSVDTSALDPSLLPAGVSAYWRGGAELEVRAAGAAAWCGGWWARATTDDGTPLGIVPVAVSGRDAVARLLVPPSASGSFGVDLTHRPDLVPRSAAARSVARALVAGVEACRAERLGDHGTALRRWRSCADAWDAAGDTTRGARARALASDVGGRGRQPSRPTLADRLAPSRSHS